MNLLFESCQINNITLANRFVRSATWEGMATEDGAVTPQLIRTLETLALGGVGLIITSHAYIRKDGQASPRQLGIDNDSLIPGLSELTDGVHEAGGKIVCQLSHAGNFASEKLTGQIPVAVSDFQGLARTPRKALSIHDIQDIVHTFTEAAVRAKEAGFNGIELHSAHGYLLSQFLSPIFNRRSDEYGGDVQNRARILVKIIRTLRNEIGEDYPILVKLNGQDYTEGGLSIHDSIQAARLMDQAGCDAVELSGGLLNNNTLSPTRIGLRPADNEPFYQDEAKAFKNALSVPLILVGGIRSCEVADMLVTSGFADFIAMSRPLIREPDLIRRWQSGNTKKSACVSDNLCFRPGLRGKGIYCVTEEKERSRE